MKSVTYLITCLQEEAEELRTSIAQQADGYREQLEAANALMLEWQQYAAALEAQAPADDAAAGDAQEPAADAVPAAAGGLDGEPRCNLAAEQVLFCCACQG